MVLKMVSIVILRSIMLVLDGGTGKGQGINQRVAESHKALKEYWLIQE